MKTNESIFGIAGDWHNNLPWVLRAVQAFKACGVRTILHCGDFGVGTAGTQPEYSRKLSEALADANMDIIVAPGNHEDYALIASLEPDESGLLPYADRVFLAPRGWRLHAGGKTIAFLGGAASIDFTTRTKGVDWWPEEMITTSDIYRFAEGGAADIMITHEAPEGTAKISDIRTESENDWLDIEIEWAAKSRKMMSHAVRFAKPKMLFHGHYHTGYTEDVLYPDFGEGAFALRIFGMHMNGFHKNLGILRPADYSFEWLPRELPS